VCLYTLFRCVGVLVDHCLLALSIVSFVLAAVRLDAPAHYDIQYYTTSQSWDGSTTTSWVMASSYYTIPTFFKSFPVSRTFVSLMSYPRPYLIGVPLVALCAAVPGR
jgi:hypothetical protein